MQTKHLFMTFKNLLISYVDEVHKLSMANKQAENRYKDANSLNSSDEEWDYSTYEVHCSCAIPYLGHINLCCNTVSLKASYTVWRKGTLANLASGLPQLFYKAAYL